MGEQATGKMQTQCSQDAAHRPLRTLSCAPESTSRSSRVFTRLSHRGGWIPFFAFSLPTLATGGCTSRWGLI